MDITSRQNPRIKHAVGLRQAKRRRETQRFLIDGGRELRRAAEAGFSIIECFVCEEWCDDGDRTCRDALRLPAGVEFAVSRPVMERLAYGQRRPGLVAVVQEKPRRRLRELNLGPQPLILVLDRAEKPGNIGAVMRTCDAVGAEALVLVDSAADPYNPNVIRASTGAVFTLPTVQAGLHETLAWLGQLPCPAFAAWVRPEARDYADCDYRGGAVLVLGAEDQGLRPDWHAAAQAVTIPMRGRAGDSLNLSIAAAVLLFEARRQQRTAS